MNNLSRRGFLLATGSLAVTQVQGAASTHGQTQDAEAGKPFGKLIISEPMLQNAAETSMGVAFAVSDMANGYVDVATRPDMSDARRVKCGGFRVTDMNDKVMLVRLTHLEPDTKYYYRIGADRISYKGGYKMKIIGNESPSRVYSFTTLGPKSAGGFCVINDTHAQMKPFGLALEKIAALKPSCVVWNGDACNSQDTIDSLVNIFLTPKVTRTDYAAETPYLFASGNHDNRGLAARRLEKVWMFRQPEERASRDWDLGRNFAVRCGDIAMIGLDTGEDKLDGRDVFAGLFNMEPYRVAQQAWLADALKRPDIASAPYIVAFCHIPLYDDNPRANPGDCDKDGNGRYSADFAYWQRTCAQLWGPLLEMAGAQIVITAHQHKYRYDAPNATHAWGQFVGGGPEMGVVRKTVNEAHFPTVIQGRVEDGRLVVTVHDLLHKRVAATYTYAPRRV